MKNIFTGIVLTMMLALSFTAKAQSKNTIINGKVTSFEESLPLEGVSIVVKETSNATGTQADGTFNLSVSDSEKTLVISLQGYEKKEVPISKAKNYDIVLRRSGNIYLTLNDAALKKP